MEDYFEGFSESITEWETIRDMTELDLDDLPCHNEKIDHRIHRFPRQDLVMYGMIPKMEQRIYIKCKDCKLIFNPFDISYHKTCVSTSTPSKTHASERKTKSRGGSSKRNLNNFPLPPVFAKTSSPNRGYNKDRETVSKTSKAAIANQSATNSKVQEIINAIPEPEIKGNSPGVPSPSCLSNDSLSLDGDSSSPIVTSSSRSSKKSRKIKSHKEFDPDLHCGVIDAHKGPCLRSITCSNHRIQLKKLVPGRSKDIHQLITEKRLAKERDMLNQSIPEIEKVENVNIIEHIPVVISAPLEVISEVSTSEIIDMKQHLVDCVEEVEELKSDMEHLEEFVEDHHASMSPIDQGNSIKSLENYEFTQITPMSPLKDDNDISALENYKFASISSMNPENGILPLENYDFTTHITSLSPLKDEFDINSMEGFKFAQIQPMSPLKQETLLMQESFVSNSIVNVPMTDDRPVSFTIPDLEFEDSTILGSHPKPIALPTYGLKKFGGAVLFNKPQIQLQRNDILRAVNDSRVNFALFGGTNLSRSKRNHCNLSILDSDIEYKQMRLDPNLNHFLMQCEIRKPFDDVLLEECLQENFGRNTFTSTIDFE